MSTDDRTRSPRVQVRPSIEGGQLLRYLRKRQGLSTRRLGELAGGTSQGHVSAVERGEKGPSAPLLDSFADALGLAPADRQHLMRLFGYDTEAARKRSPSLSPEEAAYALATRPREEWMDIFERALQIQARSDLDSATPTTPTTDDRSAAVANGPANGPANGLTVGNASADPSPGPGGDG